MTTMQSENAKYYFDESRFPRGIDWERRDSDRGLKTFVGELRLMPAPVWVSDWMDECLKS